MSVFLILIPIAIIYIFAQGLLFIFDLKDYKFKIWNFGRGGSFFPFQILDTRRYQFFKRSAFLHKRKCLCTFCKSWKFPDDANKFKLKKEGSRK